MGKEIRRLENGVVREAYILFYIPLYLFGFKTVFMYYLA